MKKNEHIGSDFDTFLEQEGIRNEVELAAIKKIIAYELKNEMKRKKITQAEMAKRIGTSRSALIRLLDPNNYSITLVTLHRLAHAMGKKLEIMFH
jgi:antitoxin HicB